jgi:hypothetical protein
VVVLASAINARAGEREEGESKVKIALMLAIALAIVARAEEKPVEPKPVPLSEVQALKLENLILKAQSIQAQVESTTSQAREALGQLNTQREALRKEACEAAKISLDRCQFTPDGKSVMDVPKPPAEKK